MGLPPALCLSGSHFRHILSVLQEKYLIIDRSSRAPSQPVYGNGRKNFNFHICGNILKLDDFPEPVEQPKSQPQQRNLDQGPTESLEDYLRRKGVAYEPTKEANKFYVECPYKAGHTGGKQGKTDSYVFDDGTGWGYFCSHAHCEHRRTWEAFKSGMGISNGKRNTSTYNNHSSEQPTDELDLSPLPIEENILPKFPEDKDIFIEGFEALYEAYAKTHVWSPEMLMAMGIGAVSFVGRHSNVRTHEKSPTYPLSSYILAVGESDLTAKSQAISEIKKWLSQTEEVFQPLSNVQSIEGVLKALNISLQDDDYEEATRYCLFDEGSIVFENTRRSGTKNLLAGLNELWLCPSNYATGRAGGPAHDIEYIEHPYLCCWGNIPTKLIASVFRMDDMIGGSLNRWMPFFIQPKRETMRYPHAENKMYDTWIKILKAIIGHSRSLMFTEEADDARFKWFDKLRGKAIDENKQTGETRYHTQAVRIAALFALAGNDPNDNNVHIQHWETALTIVQYLHNCAEFLYKNIGATRLGETENEIMDVLNKHGNQMTLNDLSMKTRRFDADERNRILDILEKDARVMRYKKKSEKGRPLIMIRRIT